MGFQRERQEVSAGELLGAIAAGQDIRLSQCAVTGVLDVNRLFDPRENFPTDNLLLEYKGERTIITIAQSLVFDKCIFEENVVFAGPWVEPDSVTVRFKKDVVFNSSQFNGQSRFRSAFFEGAAGFDGCSFAGVVTFKNAVFRGAAKFRTVVCNGYSLFGGAAFGSSARFANTHFVKGANFSHVKFMAHTDFGGVYSSSRAVPIYDAIHFGRWLHGEDESFWRFVKQSATEAGYYRLAGECFYNERCAGLWQKLWGSGYAHLSPAARFRRLASGVRLVPEFVFGRLLFGYGERPTRVLLAGVIVVLFFALLFSANGALVFREGPNQGGFGQGLYFSTITFTTLGYGDLYPSDQGLWRQLAMIEAVTGGCLIALFVVCLAKRFSRG